MQLTSINIGQKQTLQSGDKSEITGIFKQPVSGPIQITTLGIAEDFIGSPKHHGGPDQAVYVYGTKDYEWWSTELGREVDAGTFGENLTISELESAKFNIGDFLHVGEVTLQVTAPRIPCGTFARRMEDPQFVKRFRAAERPGLYCRVIKEGVVKTGDEVRVETYTGETISVTQMYRDYYEKDKSEETLRRNLAAPIAVRARVDLEEELSKLLK
ncbi:MAG: MOSC domain-containing protein [Anaerolineales bacterium]|nr:MOSC domain-containing protein [Anaerolineales bacterium]